MSEFSTKLIQSIKDGPQILLEVDEAGTAKQVVDIADPAGWGRYNKRLVWYPVEVFVGDEPIEEEFAEDIE